jgi:ABC-type transporter Mla subunit MlaD
MVRFQKLVVALLVLSVIFSLVSVVFSVVIFKINSQGNKVSTERVVVSSSNSGSLGFSVERNNQDFGEGNG